MGSNVGLSKLLVAAFPMFLLGWSRFGIAATSAVAAGVVMAAIPTAIA